MPKDLRKKELKGWRLWLCGTLTGFINGLFGAGGGLISVVALEQIGGFDEHEAHATTIGVILPLSIVSMLIYAANGSVDWNASFLIAVGSLPGGALGAWLLGRIKPIWVNRILCIAMLVAAIKLLI